MDSDGSNLKQLTDDIASEFGPAWSPGGTQIAFTNPSLYTMDADGSNVSSVATAEVLIHHGPTWSPDGTTLAFEGEQPPGESNADIYTIDLESEKLTNLTNSPGITEVNPDFSPDGSQLCFSRKVAKPSGAVGGALYAMDADGSNATRLSGTNAPADLNAGGCDWSPDGTKIAFAYFVDGAEEVYVTNADGSGQTNLTNSPARDINPGWSPDGTKITFASSGQADFDIYTMDADGSNPTNLTNSPSVAEIDPDWQPFPSKAPAQDNGDGTGTGQGNGGDTGNADSSTAADDQYNDADGVIPDTISSKPLPNTGGAAILAPAIGLLVVSVAVAWSVVRQR